MKALLDDAQLDGLLDSLQEMSRLMDANLERQQHMMVMICGLLERIERLEAMAVKAPIRSHIGRMDN